MTELHTFDEDGDLLLILFRIPVTDDETSTSSVEDEENSGEKQTNIANEEGRSMSNVAGALDVIAVRQDGTNTPQSTQDYNLAMMPMPDPGTEVRMVVSSKHMMVCSPVFRAMLQHGNFKEGEALRSSGVAEVPLPDDDPDMFIILLNIVHLRTRRVPRRVNLGELARLSVLVDKYQMLEAVEVFSDIWIKCLETDIPQTYTWEARQWLAMSWVFSRADLFKKMTRIVGRECDADLQEDPEDPDMAPPIPARVVESILDCRTKAILDAVSVLDTVIRRYTDPDQKECRESSSGKRSACCSLILGSLVRGSDAIGLWPIPTEPFAGLIFCEILDQIRTIQVFDLCDIYGNKYGKSHDAHGVRDHLVASMNSLKDTLCGLDIWDFKEKPIE